MIDVHVAIVPEREKSTQGSIDEFATLQSIREDIVTDLELGDPSDWEIAVSPADLRSSLAEFKPSGKDTIFVIRRDLARGKAFVRNKA